MSKPSRPAIVTTLGVLGLISGAIQVLGGMFIAFDNNRATDFPSLGLSSEPLIWYGGITILVGAFALYLASSLLDGKKWVRVWYSIVGTLNIAAGIWLTLVETGSSRWTGLFSAAIWIIVVSLLYSQKANEFFDE